MVNFRISLVGFRWGGGGVNNEMPTAISVGISSTRNENELKIVCEMNSKYKTKNGKRKMKNKKASAKHTNDNQLYSVIEQGRR